MTADPLQDARELLADLDAGRDVTWDDIESALRDVCAPDTTPPLIRSRRDRTR